MILIGGDTLLVVAPALAALIALGAGRRLRMFLGVCGVFATVGLLISGTRSSLITGFVLLAVPLVFGGWRRSPPARRSSGSSPTAC